MRFDAVPHIYAVGAVPAAFFFALKFLWKKFDKPIRGSIEANRERIQYDDL